MQTVDRETATEMATRSSGEWVVYVLTSVPRPRRTYCGVTNDWPHRFRQHNGELKGGARATSTDRPWRLSALMCGFGRGPEAKSMAMRAEWFGKVKHYKGKIPEPWCRTGPCRRAFLLERALKMTSEKAKDMDLRLVCCEESMLLLPQTDASDIDDTQEKEIKLVINVITTQKEDHD